MKKITRKFMQNLLDCDDYGKTSAEEDNKKIHAKSAWV